MEATTTLHLSAGTAVLAVLLLAAPARAADDTALYLRDGAEPRQLLEGPSTRDQPREISKSAGDRATATLGEFLTEPAPATRKLRVGVVSAIAYLGTGQNGMIGCADVAVTFFRPCCRACSNAKRAMRVEAFSVMIFRLSTTPGTTSCSSPA